MFLFVQSEHTSSELQDLPDIVLHCIITKLPIQDRCNLAAAHRSFDEFLSQNMFWRDLIMDNDKAFVNAVCRYVFDYSESVTSILIDNLSSPESTFVSSCPSCCGHTSIWLTFYSLNIHCCQLSMTFCCQSLNQQNKQ